jgi:hypothetical protein
MLLNEVNVMVAGFPKSMADQRQGKWDSREFWG